VVTSCVGGMSDYSVSGKIREAKVALIVLTQGYVSLLPPHANKDQANVLVLNLRNRMIFRRATRSNFAKCFIGLFLFMPAGQVSSSGTR
jgi:hypothetical protein